MLQSIWDDIRREFSFGNMITKIIIVNIAVWLFVGIVNVALRITNGWVEPELYRDFVSFLGAPYYWLKLLTRPWTIITHMFLHEGFFHILWNMLFLLWFGRIFGDFYGDRRVLPLYLAGGIVAFVASFVVMNLISLSGPVLVHEDSLILGASGAVTAILVAIGILQPEYTIRMFLLGRVRLKYIVLVAILVQVFSLGSLENFGGTIDHIGGILFGIAYAINLRNGRDITAWAADGIKWVERTWERLLTPSSDHKKKGPRTAYRGGRSVKETEPPKSRPSFMRKAGGGQKQSSGSTATKVEDRLSHQEQLDAILDKIKDKGYNSLTKKEKDFLFRASNQ